MWAIYERRPAVQSTYDTADGIEIPDDIYSAREIGTLFVKALTNSRHDDAVLSRVLVCARILEMYRDNPATIEKSSDEATVLMQERSPSHTISSSASTVRKRDRSDLTPDSKSVKREKIAKVIRGGEVVEVFSF